MEVTGTLDVDTVGSLGVLSVGGGLSNSGLVQVGNLAFSGAGGGTMSVAGTLTNSGTLDIYNDSATTSKVTAVDLTNTGTVNLRADSSGAADLILSTGVAPGTLSTTITLVGPSLLEFASGQIGTIASAGKLEVGNLSAFVADGGGTTSNSALVGLTTVAGDFEVQNGAVVSPSGSLAVTGTLDVDTVGSLGVLSVGGGLSNSGLVQVGNLAFSGAGGGTLSVAGTLTNSGTLDIYNDSATTSKVTAVDLTNTGTVNLRADSSGAADLILSAGVAPGTLSTTITLVGPSLLEFASGQIGTIASAGKLEVGNLSAFVADGGGTTSNSALVGLTTVAGDFEVQNGAVVSPSGSLAVTGTLDVDTVGSLGVLSVGGGLSNSGLVQVGNLAFSGAGGGTLSVAGTLTNSGTLDIYNDSATTSKVTAVDLTNTGTVNLRADSSGAADLILSAGVAPGTLSTTITLVGPSLLEFASGQIGTIASAGKLEVGNLSAFVADGGGTTSNSALVGLTTVAGDFEVQNGAVVSPSGSLAVTGTLDVDTVGSLGVLSVGGGLSNSGLVQVGNLAFSGAGGGTLSVAGTLTNSGTLDIYNDSATTSKVTAVDLTNTGTVNLRADSSGAADLILSAGVAPGTLSTTITLVGPSLLEFASGQIGTIASAGKLEVGNLSAFVADGGGTTSNSALVGLTTVAGDFEVQNGAVVSPSGSLAVTGTLDVDTVGSLGVLSVGGGLSNSGLVQVGNLAFSGAGGGTLSVAGTLTNSGTLDIYNDSATTSKVTAVDLTNTGTVNLRADSSGAADLILSAGVAPGTLSTTITLVGPSLLEFASGQIGTIASAGKLEVGNLSAFVADGGGTTSNSALVGLTTVAGDFEVQNGAVVSPSGSLAVTGTLDVDTVGSLGVLSVGGGLSNSGLVQVGNLAFSGA